MGTTNVRTSRTDRRCDSCGCTIPAGEALYMRDGPYSVERCISCYEKKKEEWIAGRSGVEDRKKIIFNELIDPKSENRSLQDLFEKRYLHSALNSLRVDGYHIKQFENGYYIIDCPHMRKFLVDFGSDMSDIDCYEKYREYWMAYLLGLSLASGRNNTEMWSVFNGINNEESFITERSKYRESENNVKTAFFDRRTMLDRISYDDEIYRSIVENVRLAVFSSILRMILEKSDKVTNIWPNNFEIGGSFATYSVIVDEDFMQYETPSDYDFIISEEGINCLKNEIGGSSYPVNLVDEFGVIEESKQLIDYIINLKGAGF